MGKKEELYYNITALHPEVTGSCMLVDVCYPDGRKTQFIVDCGLFQEDSYEQLNVGFPFDCMNIEFVLITHNHADHMGKLPMLTKGGFDGKIYSTKATAQLMEPALKNSFSIMKENAKKHNQKLLYNEEDLERVLSSREGCQLEETIYVDRNIKVTFFDNGHLIGSAMILVQISYPGKEDINLFFTGDYKPTNIFRHVRELPEWVLELPLTMVIESTYGYMETKEVMYRFKEDVMGVLEQGKKLCIFVFAQERAQEILYYLKQMQKCGWIKKEIPIYLDGSLSHTYTNMYQKCDLDIDEDKKDFLPNNFELVNKDNREEVLRSNGQKIILTTSGMADHGPAQIYVPAYVSRNDYVFYFTGYTAEGTFGYKLQHPNSGYVEIQGQNYYVNAQIFSTGEFSSHAKADELEELLKKFKDLRLVLINHGQREVKEQFATRIEKSQIAKRVEILGEHTVRGCRYGCIKVMGAKLYAVSQEKTNQVSVKCKGKNRNKEYCKRNPKVMQVIRFRACVKY